MEREYRTSGHFYLAPTMTGNKGLIGLGYKDYEGFLAMGLMDEEVDLTMLKALCGVEYVQGSPSCHTKAGLYTITIEGTSSKPQIDIPEAEIPGILDRGFRDGDEVELVVKELPYHTHREASYDSLKLAGELFEKK